VIATIISCVLISGDKEFEMIKMKEIKEGEEIIDDESKEIIDDESKEIIDDENKEI